jgi:hypothetical protein
MRIISPTKLQKKKLREMMLKLFPRYRLVRVANDGIVSLYKSIWSILFFAPEKAHITELCTVQIPERLQELYYKKFKDNDTPAYEEVYNRYSHVILELLHHRSKDIIDYLYNEFVNVKYGIRRNYYSANKTLPEITFTLSEILRNPVKKDGIVLSRLSNAYVRESLKQWKKSVFVFNNPKILSNYLNLWFKKEVKDKIKQLVPEYHIQIQVA